MREIKFRVWSEERKQMLDIQRHSFKTGKSMPYGWNMEYVFDGLMQYTGLKDKNGKEIYEGDIVTCSNGMAYKYAVSFSCGCFEGYDEASGFTRKLCDMAELEVIGNIYENPELLGQI